MMKMIFFFLALVAMASAGILGEGPEVYSAVTTKQVHSPFATSSSSRVQQFNDLTYVAPVVASAPVVAAAAPVVAAAAPVVAAAAPVVAAAAPVVAAAAPVAKYYSAPLAYTASSNYGYSGYW